MHVVAFIIIILIALWVYYLYVRWMWVNLFPDFLVVTMVVLVALVPILYGRALFKSFAVSGWRSLALLPVAGALGVCYADVCLTTIRCARHFVSSGCALSLTEFFGSVAQIAPLHSQSMQWAELRLGLPSEAAPLAQTALMFLLSVPFLLVSRGLTSTWSDGKQPARVQYFFYHAPRDLVAVVRHALGELTALMGWCAEQVDELSPEVRKGIIFFLWPLVIAAGFAILASLVAIAFAGLLFVTVHGAAIGLTCGVAALVAFAMFATERSVMFVRSGYAKCPECYETVPLPEYACPKCNAVHDRLVPGRHGLVRRSCNCGESLPTLFWFGKRRLTARCPHCKNPILESLFNANLHVPLYGGASAGKSMLMVAATRQLINHQLPALQVDLLDSNQALDYQQVLGPAFDRGVPLDKTRVRDPKAFLLSVRRGRGLASTLYLYDAAGEVAQSMDGADGHRFLAHLTGAILVIDPPALSAMRDAFIQSGELVPRTTSQDRPHDIVANTMGALYNHSGQSRQRRFSKPVAVVFAKADLPTVQRELGVQPTAAPMDQRWENVGSADSVKIANWLQQNDRELYQLIETRFERVRFFAVSAYGDTQAEGVGFSPRGVLAPLCWILSHQAILRTPRLARFGRGALEWAAMATTLGVLLGLPAWATRRVAVPRIVAAVSIPPPLPPPLAPPPPAPPPPPPRREVRALRPDVITAVNASSYKRGPRRNPEAFGPWRVVDGADCQAWVSGPVPSPSGIWVEIEFREAVTLASIGLSPGFACGDITSSRSSWQRFGSVAQIEVRWDSGSRVFDLNDGQTYASLELPAAVTRRLRISVLRHYHDRRARRAGIAISEVRLQEIVTLP